MLVDSDKIQQLASHGDKALGSGEASVLDRGMLPIGNLEVVSTSREHANLLCLSGEEVGWKPRL